MAEFVLKDTVARRGLTERFHIESAATSTEEIGNPVHPGTAAVLREHGIGGFEGQARPPAAPRRLRRLRLHHRHGHGQYPQHELDPGRRSRTARCSSSWNSPAPAAASTTPGTRAISRQPTPTCAMAARGCWRIWGCSTRRGARGRRPYFFSRCRMAATGWQRDHARAGVAHDGADLLALGGGVAVVAAFLAACFVGHGPTALGAQDAVVVDGLARGAERLAGDGWSRCVRSPRGCRRNKSPPCSRWCASRARGGERLWGCQVFLPWCAL